MPFNIASMKVAEENGVSSSKENFSKSFQSMQVEKAAPNSTGVLVSELGIHVTYLVSNVIRCTRKLCVAPRSHCISCAGGGAVRMGCMQFVIKLCTEGHTAWDCLLTVACAQVDKTPSTVFSLLLYQHCRVW